MTVDSAIMLALGLGMLLFGRSGGAAKRSEESEAPDPTASTPPKPSKPKPPAGVKPAPEPKVPLPPEQRLPPEIVVAPSPTGLPPAGKPQVGPVTVPTASTPAPTVPKGTPKPAKPSKPKPPVKPAPEPKAPPKAQKKPKPKPTTPPTLKPDASAKSDWSGAPAPITDKTSPKLAAEYLAQYARLGADLGSRGKPAAYVQAAQRAMGMSPREVDGIYGSVTQARGEKLGVKMPTRVRSPKEAATALAAHLKEGNPRGSKSKPSAYVKAVQRDLKMPTREHDGIYGPKTKAAGEATGVKMPK